MMQVATIYHCLSVSGLRANKHIKVIPYRSKLLHMLSVCSETSSTMVE